METEMRRLVSSPPSLRLSMRGGVAASSFASSSSDAEEPKYTSLKDIILATSSPRAGACACGSNGGSGGGSLGGIPGDFEFDSSAISIRNQLVKHAASAYLQSAAILATRNQSCFTRLWRRLQRRAAALGSGWWRACVQGPIEACAGILGRIMALIA